MIYASHLAFAIGRGGRHQLSPAFPRSPGIIPVVLSAESFSPLRFDCSIKERVGLCDSRAKFEAFVLNNFFTVQISEQLGNNLAHRLFTTGRNRKPAVETGGRKPETGKQQFGNSSGFEREIISVNQETAYLDRG